MESIISFRNVSFQYRTKSTPTLKNINLEIHKGEKVLIIGLSGYGKSTIASLICGMYPYRNWPVNAVSFGQKKRVTIASIIVMNLEVIILDEPTAGQDYAHYTDRAIVLSNGHIIADGKSSKILTDNLF